MNISRFVLAVVLAAPVIGCVSHAGGADAPVAQVPAEDLTLWYEKPAGQWVEALPIGNGRIGAMVFGGVERERLQLNE